MIQRKWTVMAALSCLAVACSNPVKDAQERLEMVKKSHGSVEEVCQQSRAVAAAALEAKDKRYGELRIAADVDCITAQLHPDESYDRATNSSATPMEADNMSFMARDPANSGMPSSARDAGRSIDNSEIGRNEVQGE